MSAALRPPTQPRAKKTYESLLRAAQEILSASGYDGLTSNSIVAHAGLTPPAFYRYFGDKHMLLHVLAQRLLDAQNASVVADEAAANAEHDFLVEVMNWQRRVGQFEVLLSPAEKAALAEKIKQYVQADGAP